MEELWSIVEFEDGMEMIPTSWIMEDKTAARWPRYTSHIKFIKAVQRRISYENDWPLYKIKKILGTSSTYDQGLLKLKKAEMLSDINSENDDFEEFKKSRKDRAKKIISSDNDDSDQENLQLQYPKVPQIKSNIACTKSKMFDKLKKQFNTEAATTSKEKEVEKPKEKPKPTNVCKIKKKNDSFISGTYSKDILCNDISDTYDEPCAKRDASNFETNSDFQHYMVRKVVDMGFQLRSLYEQGNIINNRLDTILQNLQISYYKTEDETMDQNIMDYFPFKNTEDLQTFEKLLNEGQINRQQLIKELSRIGGNDIRKIVFNLLRALISDKVACTFNYIGGKKKTIFYNLELRKVIFSVVRIHFTNATEQNISDPIKSWLRHANERYQKKQRDNTDGCATTIDAASLQ